jgi:uncharacterized membrane protein YcaP (DUF421 family)
MFDLSMSVGELIARAAIVYSFLFALLRFGGKKHVGELSPFDLVVLLIISETVNGALIADDTSLVGGLVSAATLVAIVHVISYMTWRNKAAERLFDGSPKILVRHGHVDKEMMAREQVTHSELIEALRREGHTSLTKIRFAVLENDGSITVGTRLQQ